MVLKDGFPSATGVADALDLRLALAGLILRDTSGNPRTGIFQRSTTALVTSTATMNSSVAAFEAALSRPSQGVIFIANDGAANVLHDAAPASNKRLDLIYTKQNDAVSPNADANSSPIFGILKGAPSASPTPYTYATAKAALAAGAPGAGAEPLAVVEIPSTATSMQSANVIYTQIYQYTCASGGVLPVRNSTEVTALGSSYAQGTKASDLVTGIHWAYFAAFDATTNPGGAKTAGWYPVPGGAEYGGKVVRGAGALTLIAGDTVLGGTNVWSTSNAGAAKEIGVAAFSTPSWTVNLDGVYETFVQVGGTSSTNGLVYVKKNNTVAGVTNAIAKIPAAHAGYISATCTLEAELVTGDTLTLSFYSNPAGSTLGSNPEDLQFGIRFKRPIRHS